MKTLLLLRHAKSSWSEEALPDHDRPLSARGQRGAAVIGAYIAQRDLTPAMVLCSTARRGRETLDGLRNYLHPAPKIEFERRLYMAEPETILRQVRSADNAADSVMVIGHNPEFHALAKGLAVGGDPMMIRKFADKFPTAGLAVFACHIDRWSDLTPEGVELVDFASPKGLV